MSSREKKFLNQTISGNIGHNNPAMDIENENNNIKAPKSLIDTKNLEVYDFKIILIGEPGVGKTAIMSRFITNEFKNMYQSTLGVEFKTKDLYIDNTACARLNVWDTCGQERFRAITRQYFKNSHGVLLVFDLTVKETIRKLNVWMNDIQDNIGDECVIFLIGNKSDVKTRDISISEEAKEFAKNKKIIYYEVSAKTGAGIYNIFEKMSKKLIENTENERSKKETNKTTDLLEKNLILDNFNKDRGKVEQKRSSFHCC
jgi:small GTP-binding protein